MQQWGNDGRSNANRNNDSVGINTGSEGDDYSFVVGRFGVPPHRFEVQQRRSTGVSDAMAFWLCFSASMVTIIATIGAVLQWHDTRTLSDVAVWLWIAGPALLVAVMSGCCFAWLRRRVFANILIFGYIPVGRQDENGRTKLYFEKLIGKCGIDGSPMHVSKVPKRWVTVRDVYGNLLRKKVKQYQIGLVCDLNPDDEAHQARIDLTDTGETLRD